MIDYEKSDKEFNQLYQEIIHKLAITEQKKLKISQIKWIKSKEKCNSLYGQGAERRFQVISCQTKKTNERIRYLKTYPIPSSQE